MPVNGNETEQEQKSAIVVTFKAPGSAEFRVDIQNAGPPQLLAAAEFLRLMAARQLNEEWTRNAVQQAQQAQEMAQVQQMIRRH